MHCEKKAERIENKNNGAYAHGRLKSVVVRTAASAERSNSSASIANS